jgi:hypothetical protein
MSLNGSFSLLGCSSLTIATRPVVTLGIFNAVNLKARRHDYNGVLQ